MTAQEVLQQVRENNIEYIDLQMIDVPGKLNHVTIPSYQINEEDMEYGFDKVDGSSLRGFTDIQDSDMIIRPDPNTFAIIPWSEGSRKMARMIGDIYLNLGRGRFSRDPRAVAQKAEAYLKQNGFEYSQPFCFRYASAFWATALGSLENLPLPRLRQISPIILAIFLLPSDHGMIANVFGSGRIIMSESCISVKPLRLEPSTLSNPYSISSSFI